jgi:hypothetical protein
MRELNARLRVDGVTDEESRALPLPLDAESLARMEISTWRTEYAVRETGAPPDGSGYRSTKLRGGFTRR